jgi:hypothetical protein
VVSIEVSARQRSSFLRIAAPQARVVEVALGQDRSARSMANAAFVHAAATGPPRSGNSAASAWTAILDRRHRRRAIRGRSRHRARSRPVATSPPVMCVERRGVAQDHEG